MHPTHTGNTEVWAGSLWGLISAMQDAAQTDPADEAEKESASGMEDCPKCSSPFVALQYHAETDDLHYTCRHCGYYWIRPCTPPEPEVQDEKQ